ncbi:HAD family hydrolase [Sulfurovum sp. bin170]|uniref:D-glycero-alpha-D-manno-heptose-1,7-bisphosphate 7-phosphatase n=1 Tax=Sulfurovum sp. bin170 TaxID=2695268 RepID=UPI0013DFCB5E|nr:HAD family hydrolase [Sulfurovum sp. bin170]NEW61571.1 HAD family hydrolase [Sulfurovum sp. bin170]
MQKALFLDRDGIINIDTYYVHKIEDFEFIPNIFELLHLFKERGYIFFIITNQSGIGRGYYTQKDFDFLMEWVLERFHEQNINIELVQHCPHTPKESCNCRKPKTGMIEQVLKSYSIDLEKSWMIGDKQSDIDLAHNAKIGHTIAIGDSVIENSNYHFKTISECYAFLSPFLK